MTSETPRRATQTPIGPSRVESGRWPHTLDDGRRIRRRWRKPDALPATIRRWLRLALPLAVGAAFAHPTFADRSTSEASLEQALAENAGAVDDAIASQARVDQTRAETERLLTEFRNRSREFEGLKRYNDHVERMLTIQEQRIADTQEALTAAALTERELIPLLERMVESLRRFVALDLPFERAERTAELEALAAVIDDPAVTTAEKFRRILAAYRRELDYGRDLAAYRAPLPSVPHPSPQQQGQAPNQASRGEADTTPGGAPDQPSGEPPVPPQAVRSAERPAEQGAARIDDAPTVDLLRVGRVALFYRSLDGRHLGAWDPAQGDWRPLPARWRQPLAKALRVARKQSAPGILTLPLPAAGVRP